MALAVLAQALLGRAKNDEGLVRAREAMDLLRSLGALEEGEALVRLTFAEALHANGDPAANAVIAEARESLVNRAARISDVRLRSSFLERVAENAATLARAATWSEPSKVSGAGDGLTES
jgi:hypothetical protein